MVELYAQKSSQTLPAAIADLQLDAGLDFDSDDKALYELERGINRRCIEVWRRGQARLKGELTLATKAMLTELHCFNSPAQAKTMAPNHAILGADDFDCLGLSREDQKPLRDLGHYHAFAIPCWEDSRLVGMFLVNLKKLEIGYTFLRLQLYSEALGYGHALQMGQQHVVMVNDPRVALRFMARQAADNPLSLTIFAIPVGPGEPRSQLSSQSVVFLPVSANNQPISGWLKRATKYDNAKTIQEWDLRFNLLTGFPNGEGSKYIIQQMIDTAVPSFRAIGTYLLRAGAERARIASAIQLDSIEQNQVKSHFSGQDAVELARAFGHTQAIRMVEYEGERIYETKTGWTHDNKTVSNMVIRIDEVHHDSKVGHTTLTGVVSFGDRAVPFRVNKAEVAGNQTVKWLDGLASKHGHWFEYSTRFAGKLLHIAHQFSKDSVKMISTDYPFGWNAGVLRFQRFMVDGESVSRAVSKVSGPDIAFPEPLSGAEWDAFLDPGFCMVALALLGNLVRTRHGLPGYALAVPSSHHVVERVAEAFGMTAGDDPGIARIEREALWPLPVMGRWSDPAMLELMQHTGPRHVLLSVDKRTFGLLSVDPAWLRLPVESVIDFRSLRWIFQVLPEFLEPGATLPTGNFFTALATKVAAQVSQSRPQHQLLSCASKMDQNWLLSSNTLGTNTLAMMRRFADEGSLPIRATLDGVRIDHADVRAAFSGPVAPTADIPRLTKQLADAGMLVVTQPGYWIVKIGMWEIVASLSKTPVTDR